MADHRKRTRNEPEAESLPETPLPPSSPEAAFGDEDIVDEAEEINAELEELHTLPDDLDEEEEGEGEDLFGEGMEDDYKENVKLDHYDIDDIDDDEYDDLDIETRRAVEARLNRRDRMIARRTGRVPDALLDDLDDEGAGRDRLVQKRRRRRMWETDGMDLADENGEAPDMTMEELANVKTATIAEWIMERLPRQAIMREFRDFLTTFLNENNVSVYGERIKEMGEQNKSSLEVSYADLSQSKIVLAYFLGNAPSGMLKLFDEVAMEVTKLQFPDYERIHDEINVRITGIAGVTSIRELRQTQLNCLVKINGVVTRRSGVYPQLKYVKYNCTKCQQVIGPYYQDLENEIKVNICPGCQSKGPFTVNMEQVELTLQETPGTVPAGRLPRYREIVCLRDLIDIAKPGEQIEVTGIYRNNYDAALNVKNGFPVFQTIIEANHIEKEQDLFSSSRLTEEDIEEIRNMAKDDKIGKRIMRSIAPSIYGHEDIKRALALALFGGVPKDRAGKHAIRGDINVLLLGDPGTAKSQFLKYVEKTANRAVFTTGQGASAVGLTASVRKDPITREWTLEGGALVLADKGVCLIDEFDKMNDADRTSIHEAMEQQSISISKAGIVTTLHARCSVIAAANPIRGRYNTSLPFRENVELTEPILSRFDVLCVVKDSVDPTVDEMLAKFVVGSHIRSHPAYNDADEGALSTQLMGSINGDDDIIPQNLLKKYIMFAKDKVVPKLHQADSDKLARLYAEMRRESLASGSVPITVRHYEAMLRMAEAHARMHLREYVRSDDVDMAIQVMLKSFVTAQKYSVMRVLNKKFAKYINQASDHNELLLYTLGQLYKQKLRSLSVKQRRTGVVDIDIEDLESRVKELEIHDIQPFLNSILFQQNHYRFDPNRGVIQRAIPSSA
ncbi:hypothetical protein BZG36_03914 [Bifiguratus adelaidae]|uniref:DNA replication licensing factor MCM2 n=1 Tax=Bifiguratus adelaidae TaxID=1938954 RepID=A0A261XXJ4_9FUNG|nr:hypothetical protein BZG36_03914 [Bifiguratus adelaidae]